MDRPRSSALRLARDLLLLGLVASPSLAFAWIGVVDRPFDVGGSLVAHAPRGDVVVAGRTDVSGDQGLLTVATFSRSGRLRWQTTAPDVLTTEPQSLAVDRAGGAYVAGAVGGDDEDTFGPFTVVKFDGADGREAWRWRPSDAEGLAQGVVVDEWGDAFVAGHHLRFVEDDWQVVGLVAKLDGRSGMPQWRVEDPGRGARAIALLPGGDVATLEGARVCRRSSRDGTLVWQTPVAAAALLVVDRRGDVIAVGAAGALVKLAGEDGRIRWQTVLRGFEGSFAVVRDAAVDRYGDVVVAGSVQSDDSGDLAAVKVAATTGAERWRYVAVREGRGRAAAVAVDARGNAVLTGQLDGFPAPPRLTVLKLDARTGRLVWSRTSPQSGGGSDIAVTRAGRAAVSGFLAIPEPPGDDDPQLVVVGFSVGGRGMTGPSRGYGREHRPTR